MAISAAAYEVAEHWATCRKSRPARVFREDIAEQAQSHLSHGADPGYLRSIAWWMATERPTWFDLSLAMEMSEAPRPPATTAPGPRGHRCPCRAVLATA